MADHANDNLIIVQCRLCPAKFQAADACSSRENETKAEIVEKLIPALGWTRTAFGWECPAHAA